MATATCALTADRSVRLLRLSHYFSVLITGSGRVGVRFDCRALTAAGKREKINKNKTKQD
jgi:hypothetical protein